MAENGEVPPLAGENLTRAEESKKKIIVTLGEQTFSLSFSPEKIKREDGKPLTRRVELDEKGKFVREVKTGPEEEGQQPEEPGQQKQSEEQAPKGKQTIRLTTAGRRYAKALYGELIGKVKQSDLPEKEMRILLRKAAKQATEQLGLKSKEAVLIRRSIEARFLSEEREKMVFRGKGDNSAREFARELVNRLYPHVPSQLREKMFLPNSLVQLTGDLYSQLEAFYKKEPVERRGALISATFDALVTSLRGENENLKSGRLERALAKSIRLVAGRASRHQVRDEETRFTEQEIEALQGVVEWGQIAAVLKLLPRLNDEDREFVARKFLGIAPQGHQLSEGAILRAIQPEVEKVAEVPIEAVKAADVRKAIEIAHKKEEGWLGGFVKRTREAIAKMLGRRGEKEEKEGRKGLSLGKRILRGALTAVTIGYLIVGSGGPRVPLPPTPVVAQAGNAAGGGGFSESPIRPVIPEPTEPPKRQEQKQHQSLEDQGPRPSELAGGISTQEGLEKAGGEEVPKASYKDITIKKEKSKEVKGDKTFASLLPHISLVSENEVPLPEVREIRNLEHVSFLRFPTLGYVNVYRSLDAHQPKDNVGLMPGGFITPERVFVKTRYIKTAQGYIKVEIPWAEIPDPLNTDKNVYIPLGQFEKLKKGQSGFQQRVLYEERAEVGEYVFKVDARLLPAEHLANEKVVWTNPKTGETKTLTSFFEVRTEGRWPDYKVHNLKIAAQKLNGFKVMPGEQIPISQIIGPISKANGYVNGFISTPGKREASKEERKAVGGGLCAANSAIAGLTALWGDKEVDDQTIARVLAASGRPHPERLYGGKPDAGEGETAISTPIDMAIWVGAGGSEAIVVNPTTAPLYIEARVVVGDDGTAKFLVRYLSEEKDLSPYLPREIIGPFKVTPSGVPVEFGQEEYRTLFIVAGYKRRVKFISNWHERRARLIAQEKILHKVASKFGANKGQIAKRQAPGEKRRLKQQQQESNVSVAPQIRRSGRG